MKLFLSLVFYFVLGNLHATVWDSLNTWDDSYELKYQEWVRSEEVNPKLFISKKSPYYGLSLDCADLAYILRAIFSYENSLPYQVKNPVATKLSKRQYFTNDMERWDSLLPEVRVLKFLHFLSASLGSDTLSFYDTYPIKLEKISSGDIFLFKIEKQDNTAVRHTYIIKNINERGLFDLIYSTQAVKEEKKAFYLRKNKQISPLYFPTAGRGFKRMKWPIFYGKPVDELGKPLVPQDESDEQYSLAKKLGGDKFFKYLQKLLQIRPETLLEEFAREIQDLCITLDERKNVVLEAQNYLVKINNRCMEYQEFDSFSTPNLDKTIAKTFLDLKSRYTNLTESQLIELSQTKTGQRLKAIMSPVEDTTEVNNEDEWCAIKFKFLEQDYYIKLKDFFNNLVVLKNISFHPNDTINRRWGLDTSENTACQTWYGQE